MLHVIFGLPQSGKSEYAERLLSCFTGPTVYIGTLPHLKRYRPVIYAHQKRRPAEWRLIELIGRPQADLATVTEALADFRNLILDGVTYYLFRAMNMFDDDLASLRHKTAELMKQTSQRAGQTIVVDSLLPRLLSDPERRTIMDLHLMLVRRANLITLFENGTPVRVMPRQIIDLYRTSDVNLSSVLRECDLVFTSRR
jgi:adenosyl cobinamide kinase/adenosyl cobinamide phosphate guanylyltransferase